MTRQYIRELDHLLWQVTLFDLFLFFFGFMVGFIFVMLWTGNSTIAWSFLPMTTLLVYLLVPILRDLVLRFVQKEVGLLGEIGAHDG